MNTLRTDDAPRTNRSALLQAFVIIALSAIPLLKCWNAPFLTYDDSVHIFDNPQVTGSVPLLEIFKPQPDSTYFPLSVLTYRVDHALFAGWMGDWAPGVRIHTWLYHALAALAVWRIMLLLGCTAMQALFAGAVFAVHPTACETVCWASERKNALAGFFGFASVWAYLRFEEKSWRLPAVIALFVLALLSKPSALGLLPVFGVLELFGGRRGLLDPGALVAWKKPGAIVASLKLLVPLAALCAVVTVVNIIGHEKTLVPPPGGTLFTALLTDVEILARYLGNLAAPLNLSFVYYVEPITSLADARLWGWLAVLGVLVAASIALAENKKLVIFGWLWFLLALAPVLNIVSLLQIMQDRYLYISVPGLLLVAVRVFDGLANSVSQLPALLRPIGAAYVLFLAVIAFQRGDVFYNIHRLFSDAAAKQPQAAHSHSGLWLAYMQIETLASKNPAEDPKQIEKVAELRSQHALIYMECPDRFRQPNYTQMAMECAAHFLKRNDLAQAERYLKIAAEGLPHFKQDPNIQAGALRNLAGVKLGQGQPAEAGAFADRAIAIAPGDGEARFMRACAMLALLNKPEPNTDLDALRQKAKTDLEAIPKEHGLYSKAQEMLKSPEFAGQH